MSSQDIRDREQIPLAITSEKFRLTSVRLNRKFVLKSFHKALVLSLVIDVVIGVMARSAWGNADESTWPDLFNMDPVIKTALVWHDGLGTIYGIQPQYFIFATLTVAVGICRPEQW